MQVPVLMGMVITLLNKEKVTSKEFSQQYELSRRSVYRYIATLAEAGIPIETIMGRGGGWRIVPSFKLRAMYFNKAEYERLLFCIKSFTVQDEVTKSIESKVGGIKRAVGDDFILSSQQLVVDTQVNAEMQERINDLQLGLSKNYLVQIEYHANDGKITSRTVEPYSLVLKNGVWYVFCYCRLREDFRYFKISRIAKMIISATSFKPRSFEVDTSHIEYGFIKDKEQVELILKVKSSAFTQVEEWLGIGHVQLVGGQFVAMAEVPYDDFLVNKVLSFGNAVTVEKPERLKKDVLNRCKQIIDSY